MKSYVTCHHKNIALTILLKYVYNIRRKNEDSAKIILVKKITMMQLRSTEQRSTVDSRRRLTNFKMLVSQSV